MIFLQMKRFMHLSKYVPIVSKMMTVILIAITILGYLLIFIPNVFISYDDAASNNRPEGFFDTY